MQKNKIEKDSGSEDELERFNSDDESPLPKETEISYEHDLDSQDNIIFKCKDDDSEKKVNVLQSFTN